MEYQRKLMDGVHHKKPKGKYIKKTKTVIGLQRLKKRNILKKLTQPSH